jgi:leucine dehydrogenase
MRDTEVLIETLDVQKYEDFAGHERVLRCLDSDTGLEAYIGIHNRNLGPALGGCRIWPYLSQDLAVKDVLRLSRGMTYKSAISHLPLGGGKAVIVGDPGLIKTPALLHAMGRFVDTLDGAYITAEDSGTSVADLQVMGATTAHVAGINGKVLSDGSTVSGDPSPSTAYGVFVGIRAAAHFRFGTDNLAGIKVAVQGVGNVGRQLVELLHNAGAQVMIADLYSTATEQLRQYQDVTVVNNQTIHQADVDVFAPCALGGILTVASLNEIKAPLIAGAANNQLSNNAAGVKLFRMGKVYAPDYVINAGGIIDIYHERLGYVHADATKHIDGIFDTLLNIFGSAVEQDIPFHQMADKISEQRFNSKRLSDVA